MKTLSKIIFAIILIVGLASCSETTDRLDNRIDIIYENKANEGVVNPSLLEDNLIRIERIGDDHMIYKEIRRELSEVGFPTGNAELNNLNRFKFNYSVCNLYSFDQKEGCDKIIIYEYNGQYLFAQAKLEPINDTIQLFELHTSDGNLCFSMELSISNRIGDIRIEGNRSLNAFRESVSNIMEQDSFMKGTKSAFCRQADSWGDCFSCSMEFCASTWYCAMAVALYPIEFIAGFAASCIGAGPGAWG